MVKSSGGAGGASEEWVTITEAANRLGTNPSRISRVIKERKITTKSDTLDKRLKLVDFQKLEEIFKSSYRYH